MTDLDGPPAAGQPTFPQPRRTPAHAPWSPAPAPSGPYGYYGYPAPTPYTRSITGLGVATQILLAVQFAATIGLLFPVLHQRNLIDKIRSDPASVTLSQAQDADHAVSAVALVVLLLYIATGVVWIIWFHRARTNVESWGARFQRRSAGWAIGAWFCPIVNLWFPYQIARDVLDDTEGKPNDYAIRSGARPLLLIWWLSFVALDLMYLVDRIVGNTTTVSGIEKQNSVTIAGIVVRVVSAVLAIFVVRLITTAQRRRAQPAATPWAG